MDIEQTTTALPLHGIYVLLAEDNIDSRFIAGAVLTENGAVVDYAVDGAEVIAKAKDGAFDIVLMDVEMPSINGLEATKALRAMGFKKPILALSAHKAIHVQDEMKAAGCNGYISKPMNHAELVKSVASAVSARQNHY